MDKQKCCWNCVHCDLVYEEIVDGEYDYYAYCECELGRKEFDYNNGICDEFKALLNWIFYFLERRKYEER